MRISRIKTSFSVIQLKQVLLNMGQEDGHRPGSYLGFLEKWSQFLVSQVLIMANPHKVMVLSIFVQSGVNILPAYLLLTWIKHILWSWDNQPHLLKQKLMTCYLIRITIPSIPGTYLSLGKWGLQVKVSSYDWRVKVRKWVG